MNIIFRNYDKNDYCDLRDMMFSLYIEDPVDVLMTEAKVKSTIRESMTHPGKIRIIMICTDGMNIGYGLIVMYWSNEFGGNIVNIDELYVKKEYRNKQVATSFIKHQMTAYENSVALQLQITPSNTTAARLYDKLGFKPSPNCHVILHLDT